jgi:transposase
MLPLALDELVPADHRVRTVWAVVERLDLGAFYEPIRARGQDPGRPAIDPRLLVALWLYAHVDGVGSARQLERCCEEDAPYRWLCGGVHVNHHTLSDFRVSQEKALDALFAKLLAMLMDKKLVPIERISQDGMRVRASAGASSFRRKDRLETLLVVAQQRVETLKKQMDAPVAKERRSAQQAAQERAARERVTRIEKALAQFPKLEEAQAKLSRKIASAARKEPRVSTTDAEARVMRMADGGFRPAYNFQFATDTQSRAIVAVEVTNSGVDSGQSEPLREKVEQQTGGRVREHLYDGGYVRLEDIDRASASGVTIYAAVKPPRNQAQRASAYDPKSTDSPGVAAWRERMGTPAGQKIYTLRASTSETVHADLRCWRALDRLLVRGLSKVRCVGLWAAMAYNLVQFGEALMS